MIITRLNIDDIPSNWIFEHYCPINERLVGQNVFINSMFNPNDTKPSMSIYYNHEGKYMFNDFSSGFKGDGIKLVQLLYNLDFYDAVIKIRSDYLNLTPSEKKTFEFNIVPKPSFKIVDYKLSVWNDERLTFWKKYNISLNILNLYNIKPLMYYEISNGTTNIKYAGLSFGYFKSDGSLYKIYSPYNTISKFFKVDDYLQGSEQLKFNKPTLIITSSLKDICSLYSLNLNCEYIAPDSENTLINHTQINAFKHKYKNIIVLFDNDSAGIKSAIKYEMLYNIPYIILELSKDPSDSIKNYGVNIVKEKLLYLLNDTCTRYSYKNRLVP